jgi:hypothetical protein
MPGNRLWRNTIDPTQAAAPRRQRSKSRDPPAAGRAVRPLGNYCPLYSCDAGQMLPVLELEPAAGAAGLLTQNEPLPNSGRRPRSPEIQPNG